MYYTHVIYLIATIICLYCLYSDTWGLIYHCTCTSRSPSRTARTCRFGAVSISISLSLYIYIYMYIYIYISLSPSIIYIYIYIHTYLFIHLHYRTARTCRRCLCYVTFMLWDVMLRDACVTFVFRTCRRCSCHVYVTFVRYLSFCHVIFDVCLFMLLLLNQLFVLCRLIVFLTNDYLSNKLP